MGTEKTLAVAGQLVELPTCWFFALLALAREWAKRPLYRGVGAELARKRHSDTTSAMWKDMPDWGSRECRPKRGGVAPDCGGAAMYSTSTGMIPVQPLCAAKEGYPVACK